MELNEEVRGRIMRVALLCHAEQLLTRREFLKVLEATTGKRTSQEVLAQLSTLFSAELLEQLQNRLSAHWQDLAAFDQLLAPGSDNIRDALAPLNLSSGTRQPGFDNVAPVLVEHNDEPAAVYVSDLHVNHYRKLLLPLAVLALGGLIVAVVISAQSLSEYWWNADRRPFGGEQTLVEDPTKTFVSHDAPDSEPAVTLRRDPRVVVLEAVEPHARRGQWDKALAALENAAQDVDSTAPNIATLKAGLLLAKANRGSYDRALELLVEPNNLQPAQGEWRRVYASSLIRAAQLAREKAMKKIQEAIDNAEDTRELSIVLEWAQARDGAPPKELPELSRRTTDLDASGLDQLFLVFAQLQEENSNQLEYHLKKAVEEIERMRETYDDPDEPLWLHEVIQIELDSAVNILTRSVQGRGPTSK